MIKKLLKILVNTLRVGLFLTSIFCIYIGITVEELDPLVSMSFMLFGIIFAWQICWGMQIRRFEKFKNKHILPPLSGDFDGDLLDIQKISKICIKTKDK